MQMNPVAAKTGGIVLCGGTSRRMGTPKAMLPVAGTTLLDHVVQVVQSVCGPVVVVARPGQEIPALPEGVEIARDSIEDFGPLAGIVAGFSALAGRCQQALVVACDYPHAKPEFMRRIIEAVGDHQAVMIEHEGQLHPLLACYQLASAHRLQKQIDRGERRVKQFAMACKPLILSAKHFADVDEPMHAVKNLNYMADWKEARETLEPGS